MLVYFYVSGQQEMDFQKWWWKVLMMDLFLINMKLFASQDVDELDELIEYIHVFTLPIYLTKSCM